MHELKWLITVACAAALSTNAGSPLAPYIDAVRAAPRDGEPWLRLGLALAQAQEYAEARRPRGKRVTATPRPQRKTSMARRVSGDVREPTQAERVLEAGADLAGGETAIELGGQPWSFARALDALQGHSRTYRDVENATCHAAAPDLAFDSVLVGGGDKPLPKHRAVEFAEPPRAWASTTPVAPRRGTRHALPLRCGAAWSGSDPSTFRRRPRPPRP